MKRNFKKEYCRQKSAKMRKNKGMLKTDKFHMAVDSMKGWKWREARS